MNQMTAGDCFEANARYLLDEFVFSGCPYPDDTFLCHGWVVGSEGTPAAGTVFAHAWIELGDVFMDFSNGRRIVQRKEILYASGRVLLATVKRYSVEEMASLILETGHFGSWDDSLDANNMSLDEARNVGLVTYD